MLFAILEFSDVVIIFLLVALVSGGTVATGYFRQADRNRLERIEHKLDLLLTHLGLDYTPSQKAEWQELAGDPAQKIAAIKAYREQHGVGLAEAKRAIEEYMEKA